MGVGDRPWLLRGAVLGLALVVGVVAWLANRDGGEEKAVAGGAHIVSTTELQELAGEGESIYWAGPMADKSIELSEKEGGISIRYLDQGAEVGERQGAFLTVVTFPMAKPAAALKRFAAEPRTVVRTAPNGRKLFTSKAKPTNYYFASPDEKAQVEVYDPSPGRAFHLASSGEVRPVE